MSTDCFKGDVKVTNKHAAITKFLNRFGESVMPKPATKRLTDRLG